MSCFSQRLWELKMVLSQNTHVVIFLEKSKPTGRNLKQIWRNVIAIFLNHTT